MKHHINGAIFSIALHSIILLLMSGMIVLNFKQKDDNQKNQQEMSIMKLELGELSVLNANLDYEYSNDALTSNHGVEENNYGKIVSQIVLKKLNKSNIELKNNRADIILKLSKDGKLINTTILLKLDDSALYQKLTNVLMPNRLSFPKNPDAKGDLSYKLSLF